MNIFDALLDHSVTLSIGEGLIHFIWQGLLIAGLLAIALLLLKKASPTSRYLASWVALTLMIIAPIITISQILSTEQQPYYTKAFETTNTHVTASASLSNQSPIPTVESVQTAPFDWMGYANFLISQSRPYVAFAWFLGVCFFARRLYNGLHTANRLKGLQTQPANTIMSETLHGWCQKMGIKRRVSLNVSTHLNQPVLIGWLKPVILLPASLLTGMSPSQLSAVLIHELAHIKRHDYVFSTIQSVIETLLFFHPAVWWISRQIRIERELCCDDLAVITLGGKKLYVNALVSLETQRNNPTTLALSINDGSLLNRIKRLVERPMTQTSSVMIKTKSFIATLIVCFVAAAGITACNQLTLNDEAESPLTATIELPDELTQKIASNDIEGTIAFLHELRTDNHPDALDYTFGAYEKSFDEDLRQNLVYTLAHFNSFEADKILLHIAKSGRQN